MSTIKNPNPSKPLEDLNVRLTKDLKDKLKEYASDNDMFMKDVIIEALEEHFERKGV